MPFVVSSQLCDVELLDMDWDDQTITLTLNDNVSDKLDDIFGEDTNYSLFSNDFTIYNDSEFKVESLFEYTEDSDYGIHGSEPSVYLCHEHYHQQKKNGNKPIKKPIAIDNTTR